jgi:hypothetical protein
LSSKRQGIVTKTIAKNVQELKEGRAQISAATHFIATVPPARPQCLEMVCKLLAPHRGRISNSDGVLDTVDA